MLRETMEEDDKVISEIELQDAQGRYIQVKCSKGH